MILGGDYVLLMHIMIEPKNRKGISAGSYPIYGVRGAL